MAAGADSIDDLDLLRHGAMPDLFAWVPAPSTLGPRRWELPAVPAHRHRDEGQWQERGEWYLLLP